MSNQELLRTGVEEISFGGRFLDGRIHNTLRRNGIMTFADLICLEEKDLWDLDGLGSRSIKAILDTVKVLGLELKLKGHGAGAPGPRDPQV